MKFNRLLPKFIPEKAREEPSFDCRIWNVPNLVEAANALLWREQDAFKNSISMAAQSHFEHKELQNKNGSEMQEMLFKEKGINFNNYPSFFKRGTFILKRCFTAPFTADELAALPEKHMARQNPDLIVERKRIVRVNDLPKFSTVTNRVDFLFFGAEPVVKEINNES